MAGRDFLKEKVDAWFRDARDPVAQQSPNSTDCILDVVVAEGLNAVGAGKSSRGKKRKQQKRHRTANPDQWPRKIATRKLQEVAFNFFEQYSISQLNTFYISRGSQEVEAIKKKFHHMFWTTMSEDKWMEDRTKETFMHWFEEQVQTCIFNLAQIAEKLKSFQRSVVSRQPALNLLHKKVYWWHDAVHGLSLHNICCAPWFQQSQQLAIGQGAARGVVFLERGVVVVPLSSHSKQGGNGRVRKVCLQNSKHIPETMELVGKTSLHIDDLKKAREKLSIEALVCPCDHPGVIKFFAINDMTMECYSQWWNGGTLGAMFILDHKNQDPEEIGELAYHATPQSMQEAKRIMAYRHNRTELAWALICIVDAV